MNAHSDFVFSGVTAFPVGVYVGQPDNSNSTAQEQFVSNLSGFEQALGVSPDYFDTFTNVADPISNWASQNGWQAASWAATPQLAKTTPILDLPLTSTQDNADQDYKDFAAGKYDSEIASIVKVWAQEGDTTQFWRIGWEMNLNGSADYAGDMGTQQQQDWIAAFQHVATVIRQAAVADGVTTQIIWNPGVDSYGSAGSAAANLYPGSQYVDVIGADVYSDVYNFSLYDFTTGKQDATFAQWASNPANLLHYYQYPAATQWGNDSSEGHSTTLQSLVDLAKATGKPLAIVETGAGDSSNSGHDVTDNSAFVDWLDGALSAAQQEGVKIDFVNIWDSNGGGNYQFTQPSDGKSNEEAAWVSNFGDQSGSTLSVGVTSQSLTSDTGISATDNVTSDGAVTLTGTVTGTFGTTVAIWDGAVLIGYALLDLAGGWTFTATLGAGFHVLTAVATDLAGHSVTSVPGATIEIVTAPPTLTIGAVTGAATGDAILTGTVASSAAVTVAIYDGATWLGVATLDGAGGWSFSQILKPGAHELEVVATDAAGNTSSATSVLVVPATVGYFEANRSTLDTMPGGFMISDTAANISANLDTLDDAKISSISILNDRAIVVSVSQLTLDAAAIGKLGDADGTARSIALTDTAVALERLTAANMNAVAALGVRTLVSDKGSLIFSVAQTSAIYANAISVYAPANHSITEHFADGSLTVSAFDASDALSTVTHTNSDKAYDVRVYGAAGTFANVAYSQFDLAYTATGFNYLTKYFANGATVASETFKANGGYSIYIGGALTQKKTVNSDRSYVIAHTDAIGQPYTSKVNDFSSDGARAAQAITYLDGSGSLTVLEDNLRVRISANGETLTSGSSVFLHAPQAHDLISALGTTDDVFTFVSGFGSDTISNLGLAGLHGDSLNLAGVFSSYHDLQSDMAASGANTVITDTAGDTLTILGVAPSALTASRVGF